MALITGLLIELILGHDKFVVNPASVTAAAAETAALVLEAEAVTLGMFMPSNVISPFMLRGLIFSIQSRIFLDSANHVYSFDPVLLSWDMRFFSM